MTYDEEMKPAVGEAREYFRTEESPDNRPITDEMVNDVVPGWNGVRVKSDGEIDWANGRKTVATPSAKPAPSKPEPSLENGGTIVIGGKGVTMFGKYARVVDQRTNGTKWINTETGKEEVPKSERMRQMMMGGSTSLGVQSAGFKKPFAGADSWDAAIAAQRSGEQAEALAKSRAYGAQLLEQQRYGEEVAKKRLTNRRLAAGDAFRVALGGLNAEIARSEDGSILGRDGKPVDSRVRVSADGKHIYLMSSVGPEALKTTNARRRKNGGADEYNSIVAFREIDANGNPAKDKNGNDVPPYIAVQDTPGGQSGTDAKRRFRTMSLRDVADKLLQAHSDAGHGDGDAVKTATIEQLGGWDPNGWGKTLKPKQTGSAEAALIRAASAEKVQQMKGEQALEQIVANNNGKIDLAKLTGEQKQKLLDSANELKKYGIDVGIQIAQEGNASKEKIAAQTEAGRNARFAMRNDREWEKLAQGQQKLDNDNANKAADRELKAMIAGIRSRVGEIARNPKSNKSYVKELNEQLNAIQKVMANGSAEDRRLARKNMSTLARRLNVAIGEGDAAPDGENAPEGGDQATVKPGDSSGGEIDVSRIKDTKELRTVLANAGEGSVVTLGGVKKVKRNNKWVAVGK